MGLDAFVRCRCFPDGLAAPLPEAIAPHVKDHDGWLSLELPYDRRDEHRLFDAWLETACPHERMKLADERISNWGGYRAFQEALGRAGWERFPVLRAELPNANGGSLEAALAGKALEELDLFEERADAGTNAFLIDDATGEVIYDHVGGYGGVFLWAGSQGFEAGFDGGGFFLKEPDRTGGRELFRAMHVEEVPRGAGAVLRGQGVERAIATRVLAREEAPRRYRVEVRPVKASAFAYAIEPLRIVLEAAVATGNPVIWC